MGLDMYLKASLYVGGWSHKRNNPKCKDEVALFDLLKKQTGIEPDDGAPSITVSVNVGYWRKANAIHAWFVEHVQAGKDECQESYVTREQLSELRDLCAKVLNTVETVDGEISTGTTYYPDGNIEHHTVPGAVVAQPQVARNLLPTTSGFFFGNTNYDEGYLEDLRHTIAIIDKVTSCKALEQCELYYQSSW